MAAGVNLAKASAFVRVMFDGPGRGGLNPMLDTMDLLMTAYDRQDALVKICKQAATPIAKEYRRKALIHDATGNLAASTTIKTKKYRSTQGAAAIAGPRHTGTMGATGKMASGNHSWLVEFGSDGPRKPSTRNRKTYINVHKVINRKMTLHARLEDSEKFARRSKGYYFIMSSFDEPTRQRRKGKGYTHDFIATLEPNETYGAMPGLHLMENTIKAKKSEVQKKLKDGIVNAINRAVAKAL